MSLFGSVLRDDFNPQSSDVDLLVDFAPEALDGIGLAYFGWADDLAQIVGRRVDFCSRPRLGDTGDQRAFPKEMARLD